MQKLPNELILEIAGSCSPVGHGRLSRTCKRYWNLLHTGARLRCNRYRFLSLAGTDFPDAQLLEEGRHLVFTLWMDTLYWDPYELPESVNYDSLIERYHYLLKRIRFRRYLDGKDRRAIRMLLPFLLPNLKHLGMNVDDRGEAILSWCAVWKVIQQDRLLNLKSITITSIGSLKCLKQLLTINSLRILCLKNCHDGWGRPDLIFEPRSSKVRILQLQDSMMHPMVLENLLAAFDGLQMFGWDMKRYSDWRGCDLNNMVAALCEFHDHSLTTLSLSNKHPNIGRSVLPSFKYLFKLKWLYLDWFGDTSHFDYTPNVPPRTVLPDLRSNLLDCNEYIPFTLEMLFLDAPSLWVDRTREDRGRLIKFEKYLVSAPRLKFLYVRQHIPAIEALAASRGIQCLVVKWRPKFPWVKLDKDQEWVTTFPPDGSVQPDLD